jgi:Rad3-related DNA helicase
MEISKLKALLALLTGGVPGILKYILGLFNTQVLGRIPNKEEGAKYIKDVQAVYALIRTILDVHQEDFAEKRKESLETILAAIEELTKAIEDFEMSENELTAIVDKIKVAIDAWKSAQ